MKTGLAALALALFWGVTPAHAALNLCNRTSYVLYAATAAIKSPASSTKGWTRIAPGECQVGRPEPLSAQTYLVYARSSLAHAGPARAWGGNFPLCVKDADFVIDQNVTMPVCRDADTFALPFATLDTKGARNWTMTLDETSPLPSLAAAQLIGVKRLLQDNGYDVGALNAAVSKPTGTALAAFRKKMNLANADNGQLFTALEAGGFHTNAPAGYTICNDGSAGLQVALAQIEAAKPVSRGWWSVPAHACARAMTVPLAADAVYLLARKADGSVVAGGNERFCIAAAAFEIRERGTCAQHGTSDAGFARTVTKGVTGYTAHIGDKGLSAPGGTPRP